VHRVKIVAVPVSVHVFYQMNEAEHVVLLFSGLFNFCVSDTLFFVCACV